MPQRLQLGVGEYFPEWIARIPAIVADISHRWDVTVGTPFDPGGEASWVAPATDREGHELVVKIAPTLPENRDEAAGADLLRPVGAVHIHRHERRGPDVTEDDGPDAGTIALLMERIRPGDTLKSLRDEQDQDQIVADVLRSVWATDASTADLRPLADLTALWAADFESESTAIADRLDPGVARHGVTLFRTLADSTDDNVLLYTDLHAENILAGPAGWRLIDPKPYVGDRCYDVLQHLLNCRRFEQDPTDLIARMARFTGVDQDRLSAWSFARCVIEAVWDPRWIDVAMRLRHVA